VREASAQGRMVDLGPVQPAITVGARLRFFVAAWATLIGDPWCTSVVQHGYYPEVTTTRYWPRAPMSVSASTLRPAEEAARQVMVDEMVELQVIEPAGSDTAPFVEIPAKARWPVLPSVFSTYFVIPKADGGYRGCLDCRYLNQYIESIYFKMDSLRTLRDMASPGDYMVKLDLRHAYLVVPIHPHARPAFRFRAGGDWQFRTLCFGVRSAPRVFTRLLKPVFAKLRQLGIRLTGFIDDVCILGHTPEEAVRHGAQVVQLLSALGFILHMGKCDLEPKQSTGEFLGAICDFAPDQMCFRMPGKKRRKLRSSCQRLLYSRESLSPRDMSRVLGALVAARLMVSMAALNSRGLERDLKESLRESDEDWDAHFWHLSSEAVQNLIWWIAVLDSPTRCKMFLRQHELVADTDASPWGFGMYLGSLCSGGFWGQEERAYSQNGREMRAVELLLTTFVKYLRGRSLLVLTDSATVVSYLNRQGGRFSTLSRVAERILRWCVTERVALRCAHLAGVLNTRSDIRSRWGETMAEWQLNPVVLRQALRQLGCPHPTMDLFAGRQNRQCTEYFSFAHEPESQGVNALLRRWPRGAHLYAFPPVAILMETVCRIRDGGYQVLLVTPAFGGSWYPAVMEMALCAPLLLPAEYLFIGLDGEFRTSPRFRTLIWMVSGHLGTRHRKLEPAELAPVTLSWDT
jgi:hypothetical protein